MERKSDGVGGIMKAKDYEQEKCGREQMQV